MVVTRVIAGPGSGKTKVLTTRIGYLLQEDPYGKVLAVTFTRKAAGEMKERLERLLREQQQFKEKEEEDNNNKSMDDDFTNHNDDDDDDDDDDETIRMDRYGQIIEQEFAASPGNIDAEGSTNPKGLERVELGTFHSICAKIFRYNVICHKRHQYTWNDSSSHRIGMLVTEKNQKRNHHLWNLCIRKLI
jgi:superfamily I DNA/RNA helicase